MDPNTVRVDWERLAEVLALLTILAFILERALALLFEHRVLVRHFDQRGPKEPAPCWSRSWSAGAGTSMP